ncbi:MAG: hypothetical protein SH859_15150 [Hyphomicrobium aestuarii]|nr:hypothetical protein [Hyphomicrobium aestuarii]
MPKRTSPKDINRVEIAADLDEVVVDKREDWRASDAKARRRQRRYQRLLIRELVKQPNATGEGPEDDDDTID